MKRRGFLSAPVALAPMALAATGGEDKQVYAYGDGIPLSPAGYASLLQQLAPKIATDNYSLGGVVTELEQQMATVLGKEAAV